MVLKVLIFASLIAVAFSAVAQELTKDFKGQCLPSGHGAGPMNVGEVISAPDGECVQISCGEEGMIIYTSCGLVHGPIKKGDSKKPYPECCDQPA